MTSEKYKQFFVWIFLLFLMQITFNWWLNKLNKKLAIKKCEIKILHFKDGNNSSFKNVSRIIKNVIMNKSLLFFKNKRFNWRNKRQYIIFNSLTFLRKLKSYFIISSTNKRWRTVLMATKKNKL